MLRAEELLIIVSATACGASGLRYISSKGDRTCRESVRKLWHLGMIGIGTALIAMLLYLVGHGFELRYVYEHTRLDLPFIYCISALWAGKEGSFLLWSFITVAMGYIVLRISYVKKENGRQSIKEATDKAFDTVMDKTFPVYCVITVLLLVMTVITRPFQMLKVPVTDGEGLSKALQDPWMVVHPPLVFIGYTAMAIMFALGMNDLRKGFYEETIKSWARKSMLFLGFGIMTGSVWAYRALGWGGYWAWDPIENIALVPWLLLCASIHKDKVILKKHNGNFSSYGNQEVSFSKTTRINWTRDKCILPFIIAIFGTFLVRSGLLANASAHAYVGGVARGRFVVLSVFIVVIGLIIIWACLKLMKKQLDERSQGSRSVLGKGLLREALQIDYMVYFRVITYVYAYVILIGTICPLLIKVKVPNNFYNWLTIGYVVLNSLLILGIEHEKVGKKLGISLILGAVVSVAMARYFDYRSVGLTLVLWSVLIPFWGYVLTGVKKRGHYYYWTHLLLLVMLVGGITSAGMGGKFMEKIGEQTPINMLSRLLEDRVVEQRDGINLYEEEQMVLYTTKPLINLFWIGSFGLLGGMVVAEVYRVRNDS